MWLYYKSMFGIVKKVLLVLALYTAIVSIFLFNSSKKSQITNQQVLIDSNRAQIYSFINNKEVQKTSQGRLSIAILKKFQCTTFGEACTNDPKDGANNYQYSAMSYISRVLTLPLINPPASGVYWARDSLESAGFIPKSYAAEGIGVAGLRPIAQIWNLFRDLSYLIMVLVIITIGFLIMFRKKINAQIIISLENAMPRIVIAFMLITFSFAIAGFLIDLMYVSIFIIISFLGSNTIDPFASTFIKATTLNSGFSLWDRVMGNGDYMKVGDAILAILPNQINIIARLVAGIPVILLLDKIPIIKGVYTGDILKNVAVVPALIHIIAWLLTLPVLFFIVPTILSIIFFLTAFFVFFKIFFLLFKNYLTILLLIIFAPLMLLLEAIPGQKAFSNWLRQLVAALLAFPITIALILLSGIIVAIPSSMGSSGKPLAMWAPPLLYSNYALPDAFSVLVGVGILFMIPNIIMSVKKIMGIKDGLLSGAGVGMFFGGVGGIAASGMGSLTKYSSIKYAIGGYIDPKKGLIGKLLGTKGGGGGEHPPKVDGH